MLIRNNNLTTPHTLTCPNGQPNNINIGLVDKLQLNKDILIKKQCNFLSTRTTRDSIFKLLMLHYLQNSNFSFYIFIMNSLDPIADAHIITINDTNIYINLLPSYLIINISKSGVEYDDIIGQLLLLLLSEIFNTVKIYSYDKYIHNEPLFNELEGNIITKSIIHGSFAGSYKEILINEEDQQRQYYLQKYIKYKKKYIEYKQNKLL